MSPHFLLLHHFEVPGWSPQSPIPPLGHPTHVPHGFVPSPVSTLPCSPDLPMWALCWGSAGTGLSFFLTEQMAPSTQGRGHVKPKVSVLCHGQNLTCFALLSCRKCPFLFSIKWAPDAVSLRKLQPLPGSSLIASSAQGWKICSWLLSPPPWTPALNLLSMPSVTGVPAPLTTLRSSHLVFLN